MSAIDTWIVALCIGSALAALVVVALDLWAHRWQDRRSVRVTRAHTDTLLELSASRAREDALKRRCYDLERERDFLRRRLEMRAVSRERGPYGGAA